MGLVLELGQSRVCTQLGRSDARGVYGAVDLLGNARISRGARVASQV